jgi:AcrR family transcriptional regulator
VKKPKKSRSRVPSRAPLNRQRVLCAAIALADEGGIELLSMRKLGDQLGVEAMSLYNHVSDKDDVIDGILDMVLGEIETPRDLDDWRVAVRRRATSAHLVLLRHFWAAALIESRTALTATKLQYGDSLLCVLRVAGFSVAMAYHAALLIDSYVYGFTLQEVNWPFAAKEIPANVQAMQPLVPHGTYPYVAEVMRFIVESRAASVSREEHGHSDYEAEFQFGLNLIVDGLERMRRAAGASSHGEKSR